MCSGTTREDPGVSMGSSRLSGHLQATLDILNDDCKTTTI